MAAVTHPNVFNSDDPESVQIFTGYSGGGFVWRPWQQQRLLSGADTDVIHPRSPINIFPPRAEQVALASCFVRAALPFPRPIKLGPIKTWLRRNNVQLLDIRRRARLAPV